ncbi:MAG: CvpA family protein [Clostridia bacterium]
MGIILDVIIVAIVVLNIFICYKKGLVKLAVGLIAVLAAIILALILYKPVSNIIIKNTDIDEKIENAIINNFSADTNGNGEVRYVGILDYLEKYVDDAINKTQNEIVYETAGTMAIKIVNTAVLLGIFLIVRIVLQLLTFVSDIITSLPIIKQFNEVGGVLYGIAKAILIIYVILAILFFVIFATENATISNAIADSFITKFLYEHNLLLNILF